MQSRNNHRTTDWSIFFEQQLHQIKNCIDASDFPGYDAIDLFGALSLGAPTYDIKNICSKVNVAYFPDAFVRDKVG